MCFDRARPSCAGRYDLDQSALELTKSRGTSKVSLDVFAAALDQRATPQRPLEIVDQRSAGLVDAIVVGAVVGAVAVAGGTEDQDQRCAEMALASYAS